jgi:amphi-Trp domain-containing protein
MLATSRIAMADHDSKRKFTHETELDAGALVKLLEDLLAGIRSGELALEHGPNALTLRPSGTIEVAIRAKQKPGRERLRLDLEWAPEVVEPVLRLGPVADPAPIEARRRGLVAMRKARRPAETEEIELEELPEVEITAEGLTRLPKERLYALAKLVGLDGRSQLPKNALCRALCERELRPHLDADDLRLIADAP